ncbi:MAG: dienelactone hydrolase family protein [Methylohalobius sp.]|nr:dienelactone hydrolase family protein [Methylohalobius sp.]
MTQAICSQEIEIQAKNFSLPGTLALPERVHGLVLFAHGSGSSRFSPRNRFVAQVLNERGLATLLFDLLTAEESLIDEQTAEFRFDIELLAERLTGAVDWASVQPELKGLPIGLFGASTGAAAALIAAARRPESVKAVVSRGGRPDLAEEALSHVKAPTLLIVGGQDFVVLELNRKAAQKLNAFWRLEIVPGATHLFEEPGALERVAQLAAEWLERYLQRPAV